MHSELLAWEKIVAFCELLIRSMIYGGYHWMEERKRSCAFNKCLIKTRIRILQHFYEHFLIHMADEIWYRPVLKSWVSEHNDFFVLKTHSNRLQMGSAAPTGLLVWASFSNWFTSVQNITIPFASGTALSPSRDVRVSLLWSPLDLFRILDILHHRQKGIYLTSMSAGLLKLPLQTSRFQEVLLVR